MISIQHAAHALGGDVIGRDQILIPGNGDFIVHSFAGDDWKQARDYVAAALGLDRVSYSNIARRRVSGQKNVGLDTIDNRTIALRLWSEAIPLPGTLGHRYFTDDRGLPLDQFSDLSHALRWHAGKNCILALMTDLVNAAETGVHRIFLDGAGRKLKRKMLGHQGMVRLSADDAVTFGLGLTEGIEDALAVMLTGWFPVWAATSAGAVEQFPVLSGIEALTLFADADSVGINAAEKCVDRWHLAGREAVILPPQRHGGGNV